MMEEGKILPYNKSVQYIPKGGIEDGVYFADYFTVTQRDIDASEQNRELIQPLSPESALIGTSGAGPDTSGIAIVITEDLGTVVINENNSSTLSITAELINGDGTLLYQWEKRENNSEEWVTISGATTSSYNVGPVTFDQDHLDAYRCVLSFDQAINSPLISAIAEITVKRVITITTQPTVPVEGFINGFTATFNVAGTITSDVISYQWQKKEFGSADFYNIAGATTTTLTTPVLNTIADNGDEYRCVLSNPNADTVVSNSVRMVVSGADFEVTPAVSGVSFWRLAVDGPLILDPTNSTEYTVKCLDINRNRMVAKMWGEGTCSSKAGYTEGIIPIQQNDFYTVKLNAGGGTGGDPGGGYAGIFDGTTVSQATALLIAGGAGGGGASSSGSCVFSGGTGGGTTGGNGSNASSSTGGGTGGTQSAGGTGGVSTNTATVTTTFSTAGTHTISIPSGATNIQYEIVGGIGGSGGYSSARSPGPGAAGAYGQKITGTLKSSASGKTLTLYVAGNGSTGGQIYGGAGGTGYTSGGQGGNNFSTPSDGFVGAAGGGGGGSSAILDSSTRIVVAGGGGGGAPIMYSSGPGTNGPYGQTSNIINADTGVASNGTVGATSGASFNGGGGGGGGGNPGGQGGDAYASGNDSSGEGGDGGQGYYNSTYVNTASLQSSTSGAYVKITYALPTQNGSNGSALQGGSGGVGTYTGGGGGGGYYGGGGGGGNTSPNESGAGGGGAGYVSPTVLSGYTSSFTNETDPYRGNSGDINNNSRFVIIPTNILITQQPSSIIVTEGSSVTLTVVAEVVGISGQQINYQWQKKEYLSATWSDISGATSSSYTISTVSTSDAYDYYRCVLTNPFCATVVSNESDITVIQQSSPIVYRTAGNANFTIPQGVEKIKFYMWGAGGDGTGEGCGGPYSGGSGGYASGTIDVTFGDVFLARVGSYNNGSQDGLEGYGAGKGGGWTGLFKYTGSGTALVAMVGGGGGAGQAGNGGAGGAPGYSGGSGTGPNAGSGASSSSGGSSGGVFYTIGNNFNSGGPSGGSGINQGNRGGGGGGGYYGGGGGSGNDSGNCSGGGGGGGSGYINTSYLGPSDTTYISSQGSTGSGSGVNPSVTGTLWNDFAASVGGYQAGRSANNGLIIFELTYSYDFQITPAVAGKQYWSLIMDGPLILDGSNSSTYTITSLRTGSKNVKMWGQGSATATGGYSKGAVSFTNASTYTVKLNTGGGPTSPGSGSGFNQGQPGGGYAGLFNGTTINQSNAIMIAGGAGGGAPSIGGSASAVGGHGGGSSGQSGQNSPDSTIGSTAGGGGSQSSGGSGGNAGGSSGSALQGGTGGQGSGSYPNWSGGGGGGGGYYGGGGGGGGDDYGSGTRAASGGGGGSGYINTSYVTNGETRLFANTIEGGFNDPDRGNAGSSGYSSRVVITT